MAQVYIFDQFVIDLGNEVHDMDTDSFKLGYVTSTAACAAGDADPRWGAGGTTNYLTNEVTPGGNYTTGGAALVSPVWDGAKWDSADPATIAQHASNPTNARYGVLYNDTIAGKNCVAYVNLDSDRDMTTGPFTLTWNASGIFTTTTTP